MNEKIKYGLIGGIIALGVYILIQIITLITLSLSNFCLMCAGILIFLDFIPLFILNIKGWAAYFISAISYFIIGVLIGFLIEKFRK